MTYRTLAALLLAASCTAAVAKPIHKPPREPYRPVCILPDPLLGMIRTNAPGAPLVRLDGDVARTLVDAINHTGEPTSLKATSIVLRLFGDHVQMVLFSPCATATVGMSLPAFKAAWEAARGVGA